LVAEKKKNQQKKNLREKKREKKKNTKTKKTKKKHTKKKKTMWGGKKVRRKRKSVPESEEGYEEKFYDVLAEIDSSLYERIHDGSKKNSLDFGKENPARLSCIAGHLLYR